MLIRSCLNQRMPIIMVRWPIRAGTITSAPPSPNCHALALISGRSTLAAGPVELAGFSPCAPQLAFGVQVLGTGLLLGALALTADDVTPLLFTGTAMEPLLKYVMASNEQQLTNNDFKKELVRLIRFNDREVLASRDGLLSRGSGNPSLPRWVANLVIGSAFKPAAQSKKDALHIRSSSGLLLFTTSPNNLAA